ncbi:6-pyruvoyl trahydropterin synthase family protein [Elioraea rosea]|uniref:6-pyruvoyl trahydropterin synthase family protein n=1 Tax=Elioraea rosea TaxID=2492390 RepID=UPI0011820761|nr:6-carboxytetrahydropterin synthase [Elioraea rosea]
MFSLTVCDHVMIAHSFKGDVFGPAQKLHGATYAVEAEFRVASLDADGLVVDIGLARAELRRALDSFDYDNLDVLPQFSGRNTTTEFMAAHVHQLLVAALKEGRLGAGGKRVTGLKVLLRESPLAWAAFEGPVG